MPEETRTEFIQFCDNGNFVTPAAQSFVWKISDLRIFHTTPPYYILKVKKGR